MASLRLHISHPAKGGNPRILKISDKLLQMYLSLLSTLPQTQKRVFTYKSRNYIGKPSIEHASWLFKNSATQSCAKLTFTQTGIGGRQWSIGRTGDFGAVMVLLGHKSLKYVLLYAQLSEMYGGNKEYICKDAHTRQEAMQLIEQGFDFVMSDREDVSLFRKLK